MKTLLPSVAQPVCRPPSGPGSASIRLSGGGRAGTSAARVDRRVVQELAVGRLQDVEAAVLAADSRPPSAACHPRSIV